ncbi:hypothetical protein SS50377_28609 [Spironucleus salmonicida]|uniref:Uncharacterized protein n=1 Tax=Spironucleus salmonicida TaxID=348837 RepID=V6LD16_9EUKA|nr:hypothetical protein SS50377_28720 [Spironucleus salmonicida]KAH0569653.1 hypothetical protein SS50377_28609 [Spironucleus salmonicida]|eukprot:EST41571.1 Hypothetical protein SS50377_18911 [Spironucleus salmonicida]
MKLKLDVDFWMLESSAPNTPHPETPKNVQFRFSRMQELQQLHQKVIEMEAQFSLALQRIEAVGQEVLELFFVL